MDDEEIISRAEEHYTEPSWYLEEYYAEPSEYNAVMAIQAIVKSCEPIPVELNRYIGELCSLWFLTKGKKQITRSKNTEQRENILYDAVNFIIWSKQAKSVAAACRLIADYEYSHKSVDEEPLDPKTLARYYREIKKRKK